MALPRNGNLLNNARRLRKEMTREERRLWYDFLRDCPLKFYKQKIVGGYILDFYCDKTHLAVELDGSQHYEEDDLRYDARRTEYLNRLGIRVVRFTNLEVLQNFEGVCCEIMRLLAETK